MNDYDYNNEELIQIINDLNKNLINRADTHLSNHEIAVIYVLFISEDEIISEDTASLTLQNLDSLTSVANEYLRVHYPSDQPIYQGACEFHEERVIRRIGLNIDSKLKKLIRVVSPDEYSDNISIPLGGIIRTIGSYGFAGNCLNRGIDTLSTFQVRL
jgi:hypothetical protein